MTDGNVTCNCLKCGDGIERKEEWFYYLKRRKGFREEWQSGPYFCTDCLAEMVEESPLPDDEIGVPDHWLEEA